jgi:hypothetical protein
MKKIFEWLLAPYRRYQENKKLKKRIEDLRKRDPFIYK